MVAFSVKGNNPKVSVIIPTYNGGIYIGQTIESVFNQTFQDLEIIIVDDGSNEDLGSVLKPYSHKIKYVYTKNRGPAAARNLGIRLSRGVYVALMDHDDVWGIHNIENKVRILEHDPECAMVYSYPELIDAEGKLIEHEHPSSYPSGWVFRRFLIRNRITTFSAVLIRKDIFQEVGLLDEKQVVTTCDDYDMWLKISDVSRILFSPEKDVFYRIHGRNLVNNYDVNLNAHLYVYRRALGECKTVQEISKQDLKGIVSNHLYNKYNEFTFKFYYESLDYRKVRALQWECIKIRPYKFGSWFYLWLCMLPPWLIDVLRNMKSHFSIFGRFIRVISHQKVLPR